MPVEYNNFLCLLSAGAFDTPLDLEPMSKFKWQRLLDFAEREGVEPLVRYGLQRSLWSDILDSKPRIAMGEMENYRKNIYRIYENNTKPQTHFSSMVMRIKMTRIYNDEIHSIDTSMATLGLLDIICHTLKQALHGVISLKMLVMIGLYLRQKGDRVDFVKLETYLSELRLRKAANLFGTLLVNHFHFSQDEIPFLQKVDKKAGKHLDYYYRLTYAQFLDERHRALTGTSLPQTSDQSLRKSSNRGLYFASYHRTEAMQHYFKNIFHSITDIEE